MTPAEKAAFGIGGKRAPKTKTDVVPASVVDGYWVWCSKCKKNRPSQSFAPSVAKKGRGWCRDCVRVQGRIHRERVKNETPLLLIERAKQQYRKSRDKMAPERLEAIRTAAREYQRFLSKWWRVIHMKPHRGFKRARELGMTPKAYLLKRLEHHGIYFVDIRPKSSVRHDSHASIELQEQMLLKEKEELDDLNRLRAEVGLPPLKEIPVILEEDDCA